MIPRWCEGAARIVASGRSTVPVEDVVFAALRDWHLADRRAVAHSVIRAFGPYDAAGPVAAGPAAGPREARPKRKQKKGRR